MQQRRDQAGDDRLIALVRQRKDHALNHYRVKLNAMADDYDMYRGIAAGKTAAYRNAVHIPVLFAAIQSHVARMAQTSFGAWPIVTFVGYSADDEANAKRNETLVSAQMKDCNSFVKAVQFFLHADIYGVGIARYGWKRIKRMERYRVPNDVAPGVTLETIETREVTHFDGPDWTVVDPLDFWPQPNCKYIDSMAWVIQRYWVDLDELRRMAADGFFDPARVEMIGQSTASPGAESEIQQRLTPYRSWGEYSASRNEPMAKPVEIWDYWGLVPDELATDGLVNRNISLANGKVLLKNWPNPLVDGKKPFVAYCPMEDPHYFHGVGKVEIGKKMQRATNRIANQKLDALDLFIDPMWVMNSQVSINTENLYTRPGKILSVDGPADETVIRALVPNLAPLQFAYTEIGTLRQFIQEATGMTESIQGLNSSQRETARGFLGRQENAMTRLMLESRLADEGFVEPLANSFRSLNRQYLTLPHLVKILGSRALVNQGTGLPMPKEPTIIGHDDVNPDYRARAVGATQMVGRNIRQQNILALLQASSSNPILMQLVNWANFARQMFELFDFENVGELLNIQQLPAVNQVAQESGMAPGAVGQGVTSLEQLNPDVLGQMLNLQGQGSLQEVA